MLRSTRTEVFDHQTSAQHVYTEQDLSDINLDQEEHVLFAFMDRDPKGIKARTLRIRVTKKTPQSQEYMARDHTMLGINVAMRIRARNKLLHEKALVDVSQDWRRRNIVDEQTVEQRDNVKLCTDEMPTSTVFDGGVQIDGASSLTTESLQQPFRLVRKDVYHHHNFAPTSRKSCRVPQSPQMTKEKLQIQNEGVSQFSISTTASGDSIMVTNPLDGIDIEHQTGFGSYGRGADSRTRTDFKPHSQRKAANETRMLPPFEGPFDGSPQISSAFDQWFRTSYTPKPLHELALDSRHFDEWFRSLYVPPCQPASQLLADPSENMSRNLTAFTGQVMLYAAQTSTSIWHPQPRGYHASLLLSALNDSVESSSAEDASPYPSTSRLLQINCTDPIIDIVQKTPNHKEVDPEADRRGTEALRQIMSNQNSKIRVKYAPHNGGQAADSLIVHSTHFSQSVEVSDNPSTAVLKNSAPPRMTSALNVNVLGFWSRDSRFQFGPLRRSLIGKESIESSNILRLLMRLVDLKSSVEVADSQIFGVEVPPLE